MGEVADPGPEPEDVAWIGQVEILNATWSLDTGRSVELRLCGESFDRVHPFKRFQKKRNGHVGTRFKAGFCRTDNAEQVLAMECMLMGWKDSSSIGQSITLWLDDEVDVHPFAGCTRRKAGTTGDLYELVLVELNDDESAVNQHQSEGLGTGTGPAGAAPEGPQVPQATGKNPVHPGRSGSGARAPAGTQGRAPRKFSSSVHLLVTSARYVQWLQETKGTLVKKWTSELARQYTKKVIKVESLSDLDRDPAAVKRFHEEIRRPYERWYRQEP